MFVFGHSVGVLIFVFFVFLFLLVSCLLFVFFFFFFNDTATTEIYTLSLHDALPIWAMSLVLSLFPGIGLLDRAFEEEGFCIVRSEEHTSELQSQSNLVCRLLLEKKKKKKKQLLK